MKKIINYITKDSYFLKGTIGVMLCLLSVVGSLNTGIVSQFITWVISFFFGWFFYVFYLIVFLFGLKLIFSKKNFKLHWGITIFGIIILLTGSLILATNSITNTKDGYLTFKNFFEKFSVSVEGFPLINYEIISGGFIGYLLVAILNSGFTYVGTQVFGSVFLIVGIILTFIKTIIRLIKQITDYKNRKITKIESEFKEAKDQSAYITDDVLSTRTTTVITPDSKIAAENTQSIAIQNPNGGVGVGRTSVNRLPAGISKAKFDPNFVYETNKQVINLEDMNSKINEEKAETVAIPVAKAPVQAEPIPVAKKAKFDTTTIAINNDTLKLAQEKNIELHGEDVKVLSSKVKVSKKYGENYVYPPISLLFDREINANNEQNIEVCNARMSIINDCLAGFKIKGRVKDYTIGPSVTRYDLELDQEQSSNEIAKYIKDISARLSGISTRFVQVVPGKTTSGLEIANRKPSLVNFKDCIKHLNDNKAGQYDISFGKDIAGGFIDADFKKFPHLLVCGTTGSGKSVFMHTFIMTLMMRNTPSSLRFILVDPKLVEFNKYRNNPFLLCPPITDASEANLVMSELCDLMDERYGLLDQVEVDDVKQYNKWAIDHGKEILPRIVVVIDEYADLVEMSKSISDSIVRIAQKARAAGIHLVIATQRPSTNVITGTIKSNIPSRVALLCSSAADSIVILGTGGAEKLLGNGDMLVQSPLLGRGTNVRVQGSYIATEEIKAVCDFLKKRYEVDYDERFCDMLEKSRMNTSEMQEVSYDKAASDEEKYKQIRQDIMSRDRCSISYIQRTYSVGFPRAGKIFDRLVHDGVIASEDDMPGSNKGRIVLLHSIEPENRKGSIEQTTFTPDKRG